jgi:L,D-transpeptidase-like protein
MSRLAAAMIVAVSSLSACTAPPMRHLQAAGEAMERAAAAGGAVRAPEICAAARAAMVRAEAEARVQARRSSFSRDYREAEDLALLARQKAESCALQAAIVRRRLRDRSRTALQDLEAWTARVATLARHVPDGERIKADLLRAQITLGEGRSSFARGDFERAEAAADRGRGQVAAVLRDINRVFDEYRSHPRRSAWGRWVKETYRESRQTNRPAIIVDKLRRRLLLIRGDKEVATYPVDLGIAGMASKTKAGDEATPEGRYRITEVRGPGQTRYYRALMLDYPNLEDRARFRRLQRSGKVPRQQEIGSLIEIHGKGGRGQDWTQGCVALENSDMDELVPKVGVGTRVTIVGMIPEGSVP